MNDQWSKLKSLFANGSSVLTDEHRRALAPRQEAHTNWEPPRITTGGEGKDRARHVSVRNRAALQSTAPRQEGGATWVVTSSDARFWPNLICFIASLREIASYRGRIAVIDYGLEEEQRSALAAEDITLVTPYGRHVLVVDRYLTLAEYFRNNIEDILLYFDADIWFADSIGELFANHALLRGKLGAAKDVWRCDYYLKCSDPGVHATVEQAIGDVVDRYGQTLQAGFIAGSARSWTRYAALLEALLEGGFAKNQWGADALALNLYSLLFADDFELLPITYNAPPFWGVTREGNHFFATRFDHDALYRSAYGRIPVRAIHCTSAVRHRKDLGLYFGDVYPEVLERWNRRFAVR